MAAFVGRFGCCLLLAGCAATGDGGSGTATATPDRVLLYQVGATVLMSDGTHCAGHRPGRARDWTGRLSGCPHLLPYEVRNSDPAASRLELTGGDAPGGPSLSVGGVLFTAP